MDEICEAGARELAGALQRRELSAREVVQAHLERIDQVNPTVNAIVTLTAEQALADADAADRRLAAGEPVGPLHGLPFAFKDTDATAGIRTTFGSPLFRDFVPDADELVVQRIRDAGAITVGKTNVPEFAAGSHTFNPVFGVTRNPYDTTRSAGGSSGGAAAALACGLVPLADGSDMGGSLRNPASFCNVVGFRPSPGRVPSWPDELAWSTLTVQGPMGRTVADAALLLSVIAGPDPRSPIALDEPGATFAGPLARDMRGLRVAVAPSFGGQLPVESDVIDVVESTRAVFTELGCRVSDDCPDLRAAEDVFRTLRAWTFAAGLGPLHDEHPDALKASLVWNIEQGRRLTTTDLAHAEFAHTALFHVMREFFIDHDVLVLPASQVVPFDADLEYPTQIEGVRQESYLDWMRACYWVSVTGSPAVSAQAGFTADGLPVGAQIVGPHHADLAVLQVAYAFEQATRFSTVRPPLVVSR